MENLTPQQLKDQRLAQEKKALDPDKGFETHEKSSLDHLSENILSKKKIESGQFNLAILNDDYLNTSLENLLAIQNLDKDYQLEEQNKFITQDIKSLEYITSMERLEEELGGKKINIDLEKDLYSDEEWGEFKVSTEKEIEIFDSLFKEYIRLQKKKLDPNFVEGKDFANKEEILSQKSISMNKIPSVQEIQSSREIHHELVTLTKKMSLKLSKTIEQFNHKYTIRLNRLKDPKDFNEALIKLNQTKGRYEELKKLLNKYSILQEGYRKSITELIKKEEIVRRITSCIDLDENFSIKPPFKIIPYSQALKDFSSKKDQIKTNIEGWKLVYERVGDYIETPKPLKNLEVTDEQDFAQACKHQLEFIREDLWEVMGMLGSYKIAIGNKQTDYLEIEVMLKNVTSLHLKVGKLNEKLLTKYKNISIKYEIGDLSKKLSQVDEYEEK